MTNWNTIEHLSDLQGDSPVKVWFIIEGEMRAGRFEFDPVLAELDRLYSGIFISNGTMEEPPEVQLWRRRINEEAPNPPMAI